MKTKKAILIVLFGIISIFIVDAQHLEINTKSFYGVWNGESSGYFYGAFGMELAYEHPIKKGALRTGLEFRSINWGNQLSLNTAYKMNFIQKEKWSLSGLSSVGLGMALFRPKSLFVWSIGFIPEVTWPQKSRVHLNFGMGFRYTNNSAYKNYSQIYRLIEFPFKIGIRYRLKKENNSINSPVKQR